MANEPLNEILYKAAEKTIANGGGTVASPAVVIGNIASGVADSGAPVKVGALYSSSLPTLTNGQRGNLQLGTKGSLNVQCLFEDSATAWTGQTTADDARPTVSSANAVRTYSHTIVFNGTTFDRAVKPNAVSRIPSSANSTNATSAKASAGTVHSINGFNASAAVTYLKLYRKASAPTVGTDVPYVTLALPALLPFEFSFDSLYFTTGIAYGLTTDAADAGTTAVAAGAILGLNVVYS
jgi:hypothetical protein